MGDEIAEICHIRAVAEVDDDVLRAHPVAPRERRVRAVAEVKLTNVPASRRLSREHLGASHVSAVPQ